MLGATAGGETAAARRCRSRVARTAGSSLCVGTYVSMLQEEGCPEPLATRVRTHLVGLESRTRRDVLEALASDGAVDARLIIPWRRLRNKVVHGSPAIRGDVHELARGCYAVTTLLYQLSFHLIGYRGLFRDFASGWALKSYPLEGNARTAR